MATDVDAAPSKRTSNKARVAQRPVAKASTNTKNARGTQGSNHESESEFKQEMGIKRTPGWWDSHTTSSNSHDHFGSHLHFAFHLLVPVYCEGDKINMRKKSRHAATQQRKSVSRKQSKLAKQTLKIAPKAEQYQPNKSKSKLSSTSR